MNFSNWNYSLYFKHWSRPRGGGVLPHITYTGMCRPTGSWVSISEAFSRTGYNISNARKLHFCKQPFESVQGQIAFKNTAFYGGIPIFPTIHGKANLFELSVRLKIGGKITVFHWWREISGISKHREFKKLGFYCTLLIARNNNKRDGLKNPCLAQQEVACRLIPCRPFVKSYTVAPS